MRSGSVTKYGEMYPRSNCMPSTTCRWSSAGTQQFDCEGAAGSKPICQGTFTQP